MTSLLLDLAIAAVPFAIGMATMWRVIWPRWKVAGKVVGYFTIVALLSWWIGHWSVLLAFLHQGVGLGFHIWFSRRHGFTWYAVEDSGRYIALSRSMVGWKPPQAATPQRPDTLMGVELPPPRTAQHEGEKPTIEWVIEIDDGCGQGSGERRARAGTGPEECGKAKRRGGVSDGIHLVASDSMVRREVPAKAMSPTVGLWG